MARKHPCAAGQGKGNIHLKWPKNIRVQRGKAMKTSTRSGQKTSACSRVGQGKHPPEVARKHPRADIFLRIEPNRIRRLYYYSGGGKVLLRAVVLDRLAIDVDDVVARIAEKAGTPRHLDTCEGVVKPPPLQQAGKTSVHEYPVPHLKLVGEAEAGQVGSRWTRRLKPPSSEKKSHRKT